MHTHVGVISQWPEVNPKLTPNDAHGALAVSKVNANSECTFCTRDVNENCNQTQTKIMHEYERT